jgi:hypothetical protein
MYRNPMKNLRPKFRELLMSLIGKEKQTLHIPPEDSFTHPLATRLGAPPRAGRGMYPNLQNLYAEADIPQVEEDQDYYNDCKDSDYYNL